jgi:magnesium transporter
MQDIQHLKKQMINLRKAVNPLREAIISMQKDELELIEESTTRYLRDVYEDIIQVYESIDTQRDILNSIMDLYLSGISNRMNQVMQVLTIIATIFIPLTFIVGVYGMNFDHIPELHWKYGYFAVWGIMIAIFIAMLFYFKKKDWL